MQGQCLGDKIGNVEKRELKLHRGTVEITPGVLDIQSQYAFSGGHCHSLALAIARAKGLNVVVAGRRPRKGGDLEPMHMLVELEDGRWADVRGVYEAGDSYNTKWDASFLYQVGDAVVVHPDEAGAILAGGEHAWLKEDPMLAAAFIEPVLEKWGLDIDSPEVSTDRSTDIGH